MWGTILAEQVTHAASKGFIFVDGKADAHFNMALASTVAAVAKAWDTETLHVSITGGARAAWLLSDWPIHEPLHWRMVLAGQLGKVGQDLRAISLYEEGKQGVVVELRVTCGEIGTVLQALAQAFPDLTFTYDGSLSPVPRAAAPTP